MERRTGDFYVQRTQSRATKPALGTHGSGLTGYVDGCGEATSRCAAVIPKHGQDVLRYGISANTCQA
jgi:hypothetical protein